MSDRRMFLKQLALGSTAILSHQLAFAGKKFPSLAFPIKTSDSENVDWLAVRKAFRLRPGLNNLNSGVSPSLNDCLSELSNTYEFLSEFPMENTGAISIKARTVGQRVATMLGCSYDEVALTRSTTEGLVTTISGLDLQAGDEVLLGDHEYPNAAYALEIKAKRFGIVVKTVKLPLPTDNDDAIVQAYAEAITPRTKLIVASHMIFRYGQILPIRKISDLAHANGVEVLVDGAHAFGHFEFKMADLGCDYYASCLHKWICAPQGVGFLYVALDKVKKVWPFFGTPLLEQPTARKLGNPYSYGMMTYVSALPALDFHELLGPDTREAHLRFLKDYWVSQVSQMPGVRMLTSSDPKKSCAMAAFKIEGVDSFALQEHLMQKHQIACGAHSSDTDESDNELRVAPNVFTLTSELDQFVEVIADVTKKGGISNKGKAKKALLTQ